VSSPTLTPKPRAVLLGVQLPASDDAEFASSLDELARLAKTLGFTVVARVTQRRARLDPGVVVGAGKLRELAEWTGGKGVVHVGPPRTKEDDEDAERDAEPEAACWSITTSRPRRRETSSARRTPRCSTAAP
jgi:hypothetical protein